MKNGNFSQGESKSNKIYDIITDSMIELLESLKLNPERWERPWIMAENGLGAHNAVTKRPYSGINQIMLSYLCSKYNYEVNRWLTFKQVHELGGKVKKGQHATMVVFMKRVQTLNKVKGEEESENDEEKENEKPILKSKFYLTYYNIFNVSQCEGLDEKFSIPYEKDKDFDLGQIDYAESLMLNCGAKIEFSSQDKAFYSPLKDSITLPERKQFKNLPGFYHTVFHEVGHWTGHPERLKRKLFNFFGSPDYAREELTAEMCSVFVNSVCGIDVKLKNSAAYIENWLSVIRSDKTAFVRAAMQAQTAANYILDCAEMQHLKQHPEEQKEQQMAAA